MVVRFCVTCRRGPTKTRLLASSRIACALSISSMRLVRNSCAAVYSSEAFWAAVVAACSTNSRFLTKFVCEFCATFSGAATVNLLVSSPPVPALRSLPQRWKFCVVLVATELGDLFPVRGCDLPK